MMYIRRPRRILDAPYGPRHEKESASVRSLSGISDEICLYISAALGCGIDCTGAMHESGWNLESGLINPPGDNLPPETFPGTLSITQSGCSISGRIYTSQILNGIVSGLTISFDRPSGNCDIPGETVNQVWSGTASSMVKPLQERTFTRLAEQGPGPRQGKRCNSFPVTPCRLVDTRDLDGQFGGPEMIAASVRNFDCPERLVWRPSDSPRLFL